MIVRKLKRTLLKFPFFKRFQLIYLDANYKSIFKTLLVYPQASRILSNIENKKFCSALDEADSMIRAGCFLGFYYKAKIFYLGGQDFDAKAIIEFFLERNPEHVNGSYLYVDVLRAINQDSAAWNVLEAVLQVSKRKKTWQYLSKLVKNDSDFQEYEDLLLRYYPEFKNLPAYDLLVHYSDAAYRSQNENKALKLWEIKYLQPRNLNDNKKSVHSEGYSIDAATTALQDIKKSLDESAIPFFLISGTLLGCIREGELLGHDKDIDLGIWDDVDRIKLITAIRKSGCFYILPSTNKDLVVIRHVNGISIDLFIHYRDKHDYYHLGVKCAWHNTPFKLKEYSFLGGTYFIPNNYDLYLTENYGDWKTPKIDFDSALDTPNMTVINSDMMAIYAYKKLILSDGKFSAEVERKYLHYITNC